METYKIFSRRSYAIAVIFVTVTFIQQFLPSEGQCHFSWSSQLECDGSKTNITTFPQLNSDPRVTVLSIVNTNLTELQFGEADLPRYPKLTTLVLSNNGILRSFGVNNPLIERLHLQRNRMSEIPVGMLRELVNLKYLDLSNNRIKEIERNSFVQNRFLNVLLLADNRIHIIHQNAFQGLDKLQYLHLHDNIIYEFPFKYSNYIFSELNGINLRNNNISNFTPTSDVYESCRTLYLNFNRISYVGKNSLKAFPNISLLFLDHNSIHSLDPFAFGEQPYNLTHLILHHNHLMTVPVPFLRGLPRLQRLSLANNLLTNIPSNAFIHNPYLKILALDNNLIHSLHSSSLAGLTGLRSLSLTYNKLTTLPAELFQPVGYFGLELRGNNLTCDCDILFLQTWLQESKFSSDKSDCFFRQTGQNELFIDVPFEDMCEEYITTSSAGITELSPTKETNFLTILIENGSLLIVIMVSLLTVAVFIFALRRILNERGHDDNEDAANQP